MHKNLVILAVLFFCSASYGVDWKIESANGGHKIIGTNSDKPGEYMMEGEHCQPEIRRVKAHGKFDIIIYSSCAGGTSGMTTPVYGLVYDKEQKAFMDQSLWALEDPARTPPTDGLLQPKWEFKSDGTIVVVDEDAGATDTYE